MYGNRLFDRGFSAFLFDMDGTLLDSTAVVERVWGRWAVRHGLEPASLIPTIHGIRAVDVLTRLNLTGVDVLNEAARIEAAELQDVDGVVPIAGAINFLESLPRDRWAIVTSAPMDLAKRRMAAAQIPMPDVIISGEDVKHGKPHPDCYLLGARRLGKAAGDCLVFEDAPAGIEAAQSAGCSIVVVTATHRHLVSTAHISVRNYLNLTNHQADDGTIQLGADEE